MTGFLVVIMGFLLPSAPERFRRDARASLSSPDGDVKARLPGGGPDPTRRESPILSGADRLAASLPCSCCFGELGGDLAPDLNNLTALKLLIALLLAPPHEILPVAVDLDAPQ